MELKPFYHEARIALSEDFTLHLVLDVAAVEVLERSMSKSIDAIVADMLSSVSVMVKVLWALMRERHPEVSLEQAAGILLPGDPEKQVLAEAVVTSIGDMLQRALNIAAKIAPPLDKKPRRKPKVKRNG